MTETGARSPAADDPLVARFAAELERLWPEGGKLGLAVSGGPDSLAILLLAETAIPGRFEVATVDHRLRPEAADECAMVAQVCADRAISCEVLEVTVEAGNVQSAARDARYDALVQWAQARGLTALATAHHADDQAETLLMRLNRGSGVSGLAGVRERGPVPGADLPLIRPLLGFRRAELARIVAGSGLLAVHDPSNADPRYDRARLRREIADSDWLDPTALASSASNLASAADGLEWAAGREWDEHVSETASQVRYRPSAPRAIAMRVVARAIARFGGKPRGRDLARLLDRLESGESGNLGGVLASVEGEDWVFRREPPRRT
ncbi:MAG: tRNA lysidine(34) synthetase TilS [Croceibacterium sp.]